MPTGSFSLINDLGDGDNYTSRSISQFSTDNPIKTYYRPPEEVQTIGGSFMTTNVSSDKTRIYKAQDKLKIDRSKCHLDFAKQIARKSLFGNAHKQR